MEIEVDKSATRRLINATDIRRCHQARADENFAMARHAEKMLNPGEREVQDEMMGPLREMRASALAQPYADRRKPTAKSSPNTTAG